VLLMDWRAPAAGLFYRATAQEPSGVVRRRVLRSRGRQVVGVEDDLLDGDNAPDDMVVMGEGALLAQISRARDAQMHSVVATIQKEQDEAIRAPSRGATIIGGGPGTGKPSWRCTAPPTCSTSTVGGSRPVACWWSDRRACS
jgi:DNA helicase IV